MAVASLSTYGGQNLMLMRNDNNTDALVALLNGSCSPHMGLQVPRSMGGLEDVGSAGCGQKRPYYPTYEGPTVEEAEDVDEGADEFSHHVEKKRRLTFDQVRSLERNFEVENKLEPERKMQLAKELGLQPRQVAVWFQNRRARWKIKQLERDYESLTQDYNRLKADFEAVLRDKNTLKAQVNRLKGITEDEDDDQDQDDDAKLEFAQCRSETTSQPDSSPDAEKSDIVSSRNRTSPTIDVSSAAKDASGVQRTMSSDSNSSDITDADSPRTSDSSSLSTRMPDEGPWAQYPQFPPENFVGPNMLHFSEELCAAAAAGAADQAELSVSQVFQRGAGVPVKLEEMNGFPGDPAFLLSRLEEQSVLPNWWDWGA